MTDTLIVSAADASPSTPAPPTPTQRALRELRSWLISLPVMRAGTDEHAYTVGYTQNFLRAALPEDRAAWPEVEMAILREIARQKFPEVVLDPLHLLHAPQFIAALEREPIVALLPEGWLRQFYLYARGGFAPVQYSIVAGFSVLGAWVGRRVWHDRQGRFTIYPPVSSILLSTIPGLGKGTAITAARQILRAAEYPWVAPDRITGSKLLSMLSKRSRTDPYNPAEAMVLASEMAGFFMETGSTQKGAVSRLIVDLTDLFDMPAEFTSSTQIRDLETILKPTVSGIFCSNLDWAAENMPRNAYGGGFFPRQFISLQTAEDLPKTPGDLPAPAGIFDTALLGLKAIRGGFSGNMPLHPKALRRYERVHSRVVKKMQAETDDRVVAYLKRLPVNTIRLAMLLAISQQKDLIDEEDFDRALRIMHLLERSYGYLYERVGTTTYGYFRQVIFHIIRKGTAYQGGIGKTKLRKAVSHLGLRVRDYNEIIADLLESGAVTYGEIKQRKDSRAGFLGFAAPAVKESRQRLQKPITEIDVDAEIGEVTQVIEPDPLSVYASGVNLEDPDEEDLRGLIAEAIRGMEPGEDPK